MKYFYPWDKNNNNWTVRFYVGYTRHHRVPGWGCREDGGKVEKGENDRKRNGGLWMMSMMVAVQA